MTPVTWWTTSSFHILGKTLIAFGRDLVPLAVSGASISRESPAFHTGPWRRDFAKTSIAPFLRSVCCNSAGIANAKHVPLSGRIEKLWREFFSDPSQWWDHRPDKVNKRYPDFKHKKTQQSLWLKDNLNPPWVQAELALMGPGVLQANIFSWNVRLRRYVKAGNYKKAMDLFQQMEQEGMLPDKFTFILVLNACSGLLALEEGRRTHLQIIQSGCVGDVFVGNSLVDMYAKCGRIEDARRVFNAMPTRDVVSCNALIQGYVKCGQGQGALELFGLMKQQRMDLSPVTFVGVLNACTSIGALEVGRCVHEEIIDRGYECDAYVVSSLVDMYAKCGSIVDAQRVFNKMPTLDVVSCNALIQGYVRYGQEEEALKLSERMQCEGVDLDPLTFVGVLNACASIGSLVEGRRAHEQVIGKGYESNPYVANSLVDMYAKCGSVQDAQRVFNKMPTRNVVSWSALIVGYMKSGQGQEALNLSQQMQQEGVDLDPVTFVGVLNTCASLGALQEGRLFHKQIIDRGYETNTYVANSLVDMYAKCGSIQDAQRVFNNMLTRDVISWSTLILGYVKCGQGQEALELSRVMQEEGVVLNHVTLVAVLNACASIGALEEGRQAHEQIIDRGYESNVYVANSVVDMYAKCGGIEDAQRVFNNMPTRNVISWSAMLAGYCRYGYAKEALEHFERMCKEVEVDAVSFVSLLSACSHGGLVDEGLQYLEAMSPVFNICPTLEHYACVLDLLGRSGHLHEAEDFMSRIPFQADAPVWMSLLGSCRIHGNVDMGERVANRVLVLEPGSAACYILLANIYAAAGKWDKVEAANLGRLQMVEEAPGRTWIEVNKKMHSFVVDDSNHPQIAEIRAELGRLSFQMTEVGYVLDARLTLFSEMKNKQNSVCVPWHNVGHCVWAHQHSFRYHCAL